MALINDVKQALRITTNSLDTEVTDIIAAAKLDLNISGVKVIVETDSLIKRAIIIYAKANFGLENNESEKYQKSYDLLKEHLALCGDYNVAP